LKIKIAISLNIMPYFCLIGINISQELEPSQTKYALITTPTGLFSSPPCFRHWSRRETSLLLPLYLSLTNNHEFSFLHVFRIYCESYKPDLACITDSSFARQTLNLQCYVVTIYLYVFTGQRI